MEDVCGLFLVNGGVGLQKSLDCVDRRWCHASFPFGCWLNVVPAYLNYYTRQKETETEKTVSASTMTDSPHHQARDLASSLLWYSQSTDVLGFFGGTTNNCELKLKKRDGIFHQFD